MKPPEAGKRKFRQRNNEGHYCVPRDARRLSKRASGPDLRLTTKGAEGQSSNTIGDQITPEVRAKLLRIVETASNEND